MPIHHQQFDPTGFDFRKGQNAEDSFHILAKSKGYAVRESRPDEDRIGHYDFVISKDGKSYKVEVKSKKLFHIRHKGRMISDFFLVEFVGVAGFAGWSYGQADLFAFEEENGFYLVPAKTFREVAEKLCSNEWVTDKKDMLYKRYGRKDRQDEVSAILLNDVIITRNFSFWKK